MAEPHNLPIRGNLISLSVIPHFGQSESSLVIPSTHSSYTSHSSINQSVNRYFCVRPKVDQRAGQLSLPHIGITKTLSMVAVDCGMFETAR